MVALIFRFAISLSYLSHFGRYQLEDGWIAAAVLDGD